MENLGHVRAFAAVCAEGSAAKAAQLLHVSQPAVSAAVGALEAAAGAPLFVRTSRGMILSDAGRVLAPRAQAALAHLSSFNQELGISGASANRWLRSATSTQLRALQAVAQTRGFSSAARLLGLAEPSVHRALRSLESRIGVRLWKRVGSGLEPSPEALLLARAAGLCSSELRLGMEQVRELGGRLDGVILVGALPLPRSQWLPDCLSATLASYPQATARVMDGPYEEQLAALRDGRIDVLMGAVRQPGPGSDVAQQALFEDPLSVVVRPGHPLAGPGRRHRTMPSAKQLRELSWLLPPAATPARQVFETYLMAIGAGPATCRVECNSAVAIRSMLLQTDYATLMSAHQIGFELKHNALQVLGPPVPGSSHAIGIATRQQLRPTRLLQSFLDAAIQWPTGHQG